MYAVVGYLSWLEPAVALVGCAYLAWGWRRAPRATGYGVAGLGLLLVVWGITIVNYLQGPEAEHWSPAAWFVRVAGVGNWFVFEVWQNQLLRVGCYLLLARAVVAERKTTAVEQVSSERE
jgi:hypothetical protein